MRVAITGLGVVSTFGVGVEPLRVALRDGREGLRPLVHFDPSPLPNLPTGTVPGFDQAAQRADAEYAFAERAGREALAQLEPGARVALVLGTSIGVADGTHHALASRLALTLGITGPVVTITTACCSSNNALGLGAELVESGDADAVLAGGVEQVTPEMFAGFSVLGALSPERCAPYSLPTGTSLGEGAGFVLLERADSACARGARCLGLLRGEALSCDGMHEVAPDANGRGVARCLTSALRQSGQPAPTVDYVNSHGTGTAHNDAAEWKGLTAALGRDDVLVSSTKGTLGHAQGAAGVLEVAATLLCLEDGAVPPTRHFATPRNRCPADPVAQATPRRATVRTWASTNSAFWGANAALVFTTSDGVEPPRARPRLLLAGFGTAEGTRGTPVSVPRVDLSAFDLPTRLVTRAVADALGSLGPIVKGELREGLGLFVGALSPSLETRTAFDESIRTRGLARLSADAFSRLVTSAIGGACARVLGLRGPFTTLTTGPGSGLVALACAARYLELHDDVKGLVVVGVEEGSTPDAPARAAAALLVRADALPCSGPAVQIALAGAGRVAEALAAVGGQLDDVEEDSSVCGALVRLGPALHLLRATGGVRVIAQGAGNSTCAVRLESAAQHREAT